MQSHTPGHAPSPPNLFLNTASYYDLDCRMHAIAEDLQLFRQLAAQVRGPILELACGTGRVTLDLVRHGHEVWGLDASAPMLERLHQHAQRLTPEELSRLHVHQADMRHFDLFPSFPLILIPYRSIQALTALEDVHSCLQCVRRHLAAGGRFCFNILRETAVQSLPTHCELPDWTHTLPSGETIRRTNRILGFDAEKRIFSLEHIYHIATPGRAMHTLTDRLDLRIYSRHEIESLLLANNLHIAQRLPDYNGQNLGGGEDWIYLCEKGQ